MVRIEPNFGYVAGNSPSSHGLFDFHIKILESGTRNGIPSLHTDNGPRIYKSWPPSPSIHCWGTVRRSLPPPTWRIPSGFPSIQSVCLLNNIFTEEQWEDLYHHQHVEFHQVSPPYNQSVVLTASSALHRQCKSPNCWKNLAPWWRTGAHSSLPIPSFVMLCTSVSIRWSPPWKTTQTFWSIKITVNYRDGCKNRKLPWWVQKP